MDAKRAQHLVPAQTQYDHPNKRRKVSVVVPSPSISPLKATQHTSNPARKPSSSKRTRTASSSPDPLTTPQHDRTHTLPTKPPPQPRQSPPEPFITLPTKPTATLPPPKEDSTKKRRSPPIISRGPSTASPSYGQERIVERVYQGTSGKFCYRVERHARRFTEPEQLALEQKKAADLSSARLFLGQDDSSIEGTPDLGEGSREAGSELNAERSTSLTGTSKSEETTTFLVPPESILEHVSAAELEAFENAFVRQQNAEEEAERRAFEEERRQEMEERMRLMALAREERARMKTAQRAAMEASAGAKLPSDGELLDEDADPNQKRKRKAGLQASDRLAATPWSINAMKGAGNGEILATPPASDTPKKRGRPKGWRKGHPMGYAAFKAVAEPVSNTGSSSVTPAPIAKARSQHSPKQLQPTADDEPEYQVERLVAVRLSRDDPSRRQFRVEWEGYPGEDTWQYEDQLPRAMVKDFDRQHGRSIALARTGAESEEKVNGSMLEEQDVDDIPDNDLGELQQHYPDMDEKFLAAILEHERLTRQQQHDRWNSASARSRTESEDPQIGSLPEAPPIAGADQSLASNTADTQHADEVEYEMEAIVGDVIEHGVRFFEVEWVGYPGENTWQTEEQLPLDAVLEYLQDRGELVRETQGDDNLDREVDSRPVPNGVPTPAAAAAAGKGKGRLVVADDITEDGEDEVEVNEDHLITKSSILAAWGLAS